jgi:hypothetical protein
MSLLLTSSFSSSRYSRRGFLWGVGLLLSAASFSHAAIFKNGFVDHSICCAAGGPLSFDGTPVRGSGVTLLAANTATPPRGSATNESGAPAPMRPISTSTAQTPSTVSTGAEAKTPLAASKEVDGHLPVDFAHLSEFTIESPAFDPAVKPETSLAAVDQQIPSAIKQLDGRRVQIAGFMLPVKMEGQLVSEFLLMRDQMMCCYGVTPRMNDWVVVRVAKPVRFTPDVPVQFRGKLQVKAMEEQGFITGVYLLADAAPGKS